MFCLRAPALGSKASGFTLKIRLIGSAGSVRDGVRGHGLDGQHQGRMVGLRMSQRGARLHQLGRTGGLHQGQAQRAGAFKCQVEVFLMQGDAKTRRKCAFDHSLSMHFKNRVIKTHSQTNLMDLLHEVGDKDRITILYDPLDMKTTRILVG